MGSLARMIRSRVLPAILAALGVSFIAIGLLVYTMGPGGDLFPYSGEVAARSSPTGAADPTGGGPAGSPSPVVPGTGGPFPTVTSTPGPSPSAASPSPILSPGGSAGPTAGATGPAASPSVTAKPASARVATRVVVAALGIDLPVVRQPGATSYPLCNVAMYLEDLPPPGGKGATYLYAHARAGMFLPLLDQSGIDNGRGMLGMLVQVYTNDNRYFLYEITEVRRHQTDSADALADAFAAKTPQLWLQTSEGPRGTPGKLQVVAMPLSSGPASPADAHPTAAPVVCG